MDATTTNQRRIYVIELHRAALDQDRRASRVPRLPPLYVGQTGVGPDVRIRQHLVGYKDAKVAHKQGYRLRPELYEGLPTHVSSLDAERAEKAWAERLSQAGHAVRTNGDWLMPPVDLERFDASMLVAPVDAMLDEAIVLVVRSYPKYLRVGTCSHVLYGSSGEIVSQFSRLPEYGQFGHFERMVLQKRIRELIDSGRLAKTEDGRLFVPLSPSR